MLTSAVRHWLRILWEPKMCRLAWQLLGMLGNVLGLLGMLRNVLSMFRNVLRMLATSSTSSACFPQGSRSSTSKIKPPTCFLISCETKGVVYHQTLGASMPRTLQSMPRTLRSMPRRPRTLPSMLRSCQASLHILGSHKFISGKFLYPFYGK